MHNFPAVNYQCQGLEIQRLVSGWVEAPILSYASRGRSGKLGLGVELLRSDSAVALHFGLLILGGRAQDAQYHLG